MTEEEVTNDWEVESLRFTAFPSPEPFPIGSGWDFLTTDRQTRREERHQGAYVVTDGTIDNHVIRLAETANRIDITLEPFEGEIDSTVSATLGPTDTSLDLLRRVLDKWGTAPTTPRVVRLAVGGEVRKLVDSAEDAIHQLSNTLNITTLTPDVSDFVYQINRPRIIANGVRINRIARWSRSAYQLLVGAPGAAPTGVAPAQFAVHLHLDVNTAPNTSAIWDGPAAKPIFESLCSASAEVVDSGDIP